MAPEPSITAASEAQTSVEATATSQGGAADSTCNENNNGETSDPERSLDLAVELSEKGSAALKENDFSEAVDCFSRALEIRVLHHGELAPECANAYYQYGRALLYKAQEEADPLGMVPKKDSESKQNDDKDVACKNVLNGESSTTSASKKNPGDTMEKVDILSTLAEVALEREDIETSLNDYQKSLSILERLVEPDSRHLAELNFRICLCLEIGSKPQEAIPYCQKAISVCKALLQRLINEVKSSGESTTTPAISELDEGDEVKSSGESATTPAITELDEGVHQLSNMQADKEAEIETLTGLSGELEKKLEDLQQLVLNPKSILSEILGMVAAKGKGGEKSAFPTAMSSSQMGTATSSGGFDSPTMSTAHTNGVSGVTDLGVVGRGVKRVLTSTGSVGSSTVKKPTPDPSSDKGDGKTI
ncbi:hypothetical protein OIU77_003374 [Salix suchowensis]|uniref:Tetratricopeptide SHNi-TPR domain-containing protein n=1 Tax=Salix suchowensis TaxID=1278906 RepID=A0ABQ9B1J6_9ROSI|nr:hypothetical protein OIU77_003374 [Salix suchowensis]